MKLLPVGAAKKTESTETSATKLQDEINKERGAIIDGAIVKIMKTNKDTLVRH